MTQINSLLPEYIYPETQENKLIAKRIFLDNLDECIYFPKYFEIETIRACNARCKMCSYSDWESKNNISIDMDLFKKIVNEMSHYKDWIECVCLSRNGEPTLDKYLVNRVFMLKTVGIKKVNFSTNGQLLKTELIKALMEAGLDDIMISIDSLNKEIFESIRICLNFDVVLKNTLNLIKLRDKHKPDLNIRIRMVKMKENEGELDSYIKFWRTKLKATDDVYAMDIHSWGNQIFSEKKYKIDSLADKPCVSPFSTMIILADGTVPLCGNDYNTKMKMGNLKFNTIKATWNDKSFSQVRHCHSNGNRNQIWMCKGCDIWTRQTYGIKN